MLRRLGLVLVATTLLGVGFAATAGADVGRPGGNQVTVVHGVVPALPILRQDPSDPPVRAGALLGVALVLAALAVVARRPVPFRRTAERSPTRRRLALGGVSSRAPPRLLTA